MAPVAVFFQEEARPSIVRRGCQLRPRRIDALTAIPVGTDLLLCGGVDGLSRDGAAGG
jgi:hypothetical protein